MELQLPNHDEGVMALKGGVARCFPTRRESHIRLDCPELSRPEWIVFFVMSAALIHNFFLRQCYCVSAIENKVGYTGFWATLVVTEMQLVSLCSVRCVSRK